MESGAVPGLLIFTGINDPPPTVAGPILIEVVEVLQLPISPIHVVKAGWAEAALDKAVALKSTQRKRKALELMNHLPNNLRTYSIGILSTATMCQPSASSFFRVFCEAAPYAFSFCNGSGFPAQLCGESAGLPGLGCRN